MDDQQKRQAYIRMLERMIASGEKLLTEPCSPKEYRQTQFSVDRLKGDLARARAAQ